MNIVQTIASELSIQTWQVEAVIKLIDEGNTIPFIARYRKEAHGTLDDEQLRGLDERLRYLRALEEKAALSLKPVYYDLISLRIRPAYTSLTGILS